jgi:hypothetical protein
MTIETFMKSLDCISQFAIALKYLSQPRRRRDHMLTFSPH